MENHKTESKEVKFLLIGISVLFLFVMLVLPLFVVVTEALKKGWQVYIEAVTDSYTIDALMLTLKATVIAVLCNTFFGLCAAWAVTRFQFKGKKILTTLIDVPVTVSPIIAGLIYLLVFGKQSILYPYLQKAGIQIVFAVPGIILATVFVTFPFVFRELLPVLESIGTDEEEAAALMGAKGWTIFSKITFPHIKWALLYGIVLCTARAMGEFGAVSVLSGHLRGLTNTLPLHVEILFNEFQYVPAFAVSSILGDYGCHSSDHTKYHGTSGQKGGSIMYVELKDINKTFGDYKASDHVSFGIEKGKLIGLLGPSGSGKTTILRMIAGLEQPDSGEIIIDGRVVNDIPASERGIGFVFQSYALFRYMTVYDNIAFGLKVQKADKTYIKKRVTELIELIGLKGLEKRYPSQLSGGQRQRVAFARALAPNPQLLLLDEPFAAIDAKIRQELRTWLKDMIEKLGITSIFVTHDQDEAIEVADEIIITNRGHIEQKGSPVEVYQSPETAFSASFFGQAAIVKDYHIFNYFEDVDGADHAIVRPEFIKVTRKNEVQKYKSSASEAVVERVAFRGSYFELGLKVGDVRLSARRGLDEPLVHTGETVDVFVQRIFVIKENKVYTLENSSAKEDYLVI